VVDGPRPTHQRYTSGLKTIYNRVYQKNQARFVRSYSGLGGCKLLKILINCLDDVIERYVFGD
jgi:hypothetical protein